MNTYGTSVGKRNYKNEPDGKPRVEKKNDYNEKKKKVPDELNSSLEMTGESLWWVSRKYPILKTERKKKWRKVNRTSETWAR